MGLSRQEMLDKGYWAIKKQGPAGLGRTPTYFNPHTHKMCLVGHLLWEANEKSLPPKLVGDTYYTADRLREVHDDAGNPVEFNIPWGHDDDNYVAELQRTHDRAFSESLTSDGQYSFDELFEENIDKFVEEFQLTHPNPSSEEK